MPGNRADPISVHEAVRIAQRIFGTSEQPKGVAANDEAYVIGFNTAFNTATMTSSWVYTYKQTGEYQLIGSGVMSQIASSIHPVDYR
jgi:hypothetical protein